MLDAGQSSVDDDPEGESGGSTDGGDTDRTGPSSLALPFSLTAATAAAAAAAAGGGGGVLPTAATWPVVAAAVALAPVLDARGNPTPS